MRTRVLIAALVAAGLGVLVHAAADSKDVLAEKLAHTRNLAKAYYENPNKKKEAVAEFKKALDLAPESARERLNYGLALLRAGKTTEGMAELEKVQKQDPSIPHTWFNLGIEYKKLGEFEKAIEQLEQMVKLVPDEAKSHYNLGVLYKRAGRDKDAMKKFEVAAELDPSLAAPHFQLFNSYRTTGNREAAQRELAIFKKIKAAQKGAVIGEDMNWSFYSEVLDIIEPQPVRGTPEEMRFTAVPLSGGVDSATAGMLALDTNGDGKPNLLVWSKQGLLLYVDEERPVAKSGLDGVSGVTSAAAADFDNDGLTDLAVTTTRGALLFKNAGGKFAPHTFPALAQGFAKAVWLDFDHDNDLDLFLFGKVSRLLRNQGEAGFVDRTKDFPFTNDAVIDAAVFRVEPDTKMMDMVVSHPDGAGTLYRDRLAGQYKAQPFNLLPAGARGLHALDADNDSRIDLAYVAGGAAGVLLNKEGKFEAASVEAKGTPVFADLEGRGFEDLIAGGHIHRNLGQGRFAAGTKAEGLIDGTAGVAADFNGDTKIDVMLAGTEGGVRLLENGRSSDNRWLHVTLQGRKAPKLAPGSEVEVKTGLHYQKKLYSGLPLLFGLGSIQQADTVRMTWSNGLIQNAVNQATNVTIAYIEEERLSGSCPMVWTWDGEGFRFISDVLGVGPLGVLIGENEFFPADHDEFVLLPEGALRENDGEYEVRMTQELAEVVYMDEVKLLAVDHPGDTEIFTNEKFSVPAPEFKLFGVRERTYPVKALDHAGHDVRPVLLTGDGNYVDTIPRTARRGVAQLHSLELDFGRSAPDNDAVLVMRGWVDWADGSTYRGHSQEAPEGLISPYVQVRNERGEWVTVLEHMGIPAGLPKTVVIDLAGKFLSDSREVRIVTNMCLYWDEIFLATNAGQPEVRLTELRSKDAEVRFRGFSRIKVDPDGRHPQQFFYEHPEPSAMWSQTPGNYTRYGKVTELLAKTDDRFVVYGAGDEVRLRFDAAALPPLKKGWKRTFVLGVDGWEKDQDPNTITSRSVEPLPFHGMSRYPYPEGEHHPHPEYAEKYNTRPARRLIESLASRD